MKNVLYTVKSLDATSTKIVKNAWQIVKNARQTDTKKSVHQLWFEFSDICVCIHCRAFNKNMCKTNPNRIRFLGPPCHETTSALLVQSNTHMTWVWLYETLAILSISSKKYLPIGEYNRSWTGIDCHQFTSFHQFKSELFLSLKIEKLWNYQEKSIILLALDNLNPSNSGCVRIQLHKRHFYGNTEGNEVKETQISINPISWCNISQTNNVRSVAYITVIFRSILTHLSYAPRESRDSATEKKIVIWKAIPDAIQSSNGIVQGNHTNTYYMAGQTNQDSHSPN